MPVCAFPSKPGQRGRFGALMVAGMAKVDGTSSSASSVVLVVLE